MRSQITSHLVIWHLSLVILLTLAGCGMLTPTTPAATPPAPTVLPTDTPTPTPEAQALITTLRLWLPEELDPYGEAPGMNLLAQQSADFGAAHPDLQVEITVKKAHGRGGLLDFLRTARDAAPSVLPDLVVLDATELKTAAGSGLIQPLDTLLPPVTLNDRFPFATELGTVDGQTFGLVVGVDMQHMAYRPAALASPPVSWTQVLSPPVPFLFPAGASNGQVNDATLIQYMAAGGALADSTGRPWLDEDTLVSVLDFYSDCVGTGAISPPTVLDITDADQAWERFRAGEGMMTVVRARRYWLEADDTVAPAAIPTHDGRPFGIARGWVIALVTAEPGRQGQALTLLDWLITAERNAEWTRATGYLPGTRSALRLWDISERERTVLRNLLESTAVAPRPETLAKVGPAMQDAVEAVLSGRATPQQAAASAVESLGQ
jgi:ABC-type glycerol-3-phosphate transport system substrate-binding protein